MNTVKLGSSGSDVQKLAKLLGLSDRTVCDQAMSDAIKSYQKAWGLTADGVAGYKTWKNIMIADRYKKNSSGKVTDSDYELFASLLGCEPEMIKAFIKVESGGSGFLPSGRPRILFESYQFYKQLKAVGINPSKYLPANSDIIKTKWVKDYKGGEQEWGRLEKARGIHKDAANKSASWGMLQIMGFNYSMCGCSSIDSFVSGMERDEFTQLSLGIEFMKSYGLTGYLISHDFVNLAKKYNGAGYAANKYDIKLKNAYYEYKKAKKA